MDISCTFQHQGEGKGRRRRREGENRGGEGREGRGVWIRQWFQLQIICSS